MWWFLAFSILFVATTKIPKAKEPKPLRLEDIESPTADEGLDIPVVFGTVVVDAPNVVWFGDLGTTPVRQKNSKKG